MELQMKYTVIRSSRKTLALSVTKSGLVVRAPLWVSERRIRDFVTSKSDWIEKQLEKRKKLFCAAEETQPLTQEEIRGLYEKAKAELPGRVRYYAGLLGISYGRITVRRQRSRWGSCSSKGNLNFNCLLMLAPPEVVDSVVVHELCHRREMNHSPRFYAEVLRVFPAYRDCEKWLKENGPLLMLRAEQAYEPLS